MNIYRSLLIILAGSVFFISCKDDKTANGVDGNIDTDALYLDFKVWSEEGRENAVVKLQFRMGGPNGVAIVMKEPGEVLLDGEEIGPDSTRFDGAYYETVRPLMQFAGTHTIKFAGPDKKGYEAEFEFITFELDPGVPSQMDRDDLVFTFKGLNEKDVLRVWLSDTLFTSDDINDIDTVRNGRLVISRERLNNIANGPINLQFHREVELPLQNITNNGGRIYMTYALKREFYLVD